MQLNDNMYYTGLTNLALFIDMFATNKSNRTKTLIDEFTSEPVSYGDTKIFRSLPWPEISDYSPNSSLLENNTPSFTPRGESESVEVYEETISIEHYKLIKNTMFREVVKFAVTNEYGANQFVATVLSNIEAAKNDFLYDTIINELYSMDSYAEEEVELIDLSEVTQPSEIEAGTILNQKAISLAIQKVIDGMTHYTDLYNAPGLKQSVDLSDLRLVVFQPYKNKAVVDLYAELLNSGVINENFPRPTMVTIPEIKAKQCDNYDSKVVGLIMHKKALQLFFGLVYMGEFFDPSVLRINNFLHFWYGLGSINQVPICRIKIK